jgi:hypothetical protein
MLCTVWLCCLLAATSRILCLRAICWVLYLPTTHAMFEAPPFLMSSWSHVLSRTAAGNESLAFSIEGFFFFFFFRCVQLWCRADRQDRARGRARPHVAGPWGHPSVRRCGHACALPCVGVPKSWCRSRWGCRRGTAGQGSSGPGQADTACVFALGFICPLPKGREQQSSWREAWPERRTKQEGSNSMRTHAYIKAHGGHCIA